MHIVNWGFAGVEKFEQSLREAFVVDHSSSKLKCYENCTARINQTFIV